MTIDQVFLDELNANSRGYQVKVRVTEKNKAKESPQKKVTYQSMLVEDDKGHKMKATLFGDQVEEYKDVIAYNGEYKIANALIRPLNERWRGSPSLLEYQMSFGKYTIVQPIDSSYERVMPDSEKILLIPKLADCSKRLGVQEGTTKQDPHNTGQLGGAKTARTASDPFEEASASKSKHVRTEAAAPSAKRRLVLPVQSVSSDDEVPETTLVDDMLDALSTYSNAYEPNGSPSPSPGPRSPLDD